MYSRPAVLWRGVRRRCPRCGGGDLFVTRFRMKRRCPACDYSFQRHDDDAFFLGALTLNFALTEGVLGVLLLVAFAVTLPDPPLVRLVVSIVPLMVVAPIVFYPWSHTVWAAIDFMLRGDEKQPSPH